MPQENVVRSSDFLLIHGNGVKDPKRIAEMARQFREVPGYRRMQGEGFDDGYQSAPVNWAISSPRKKGFFNKLKEITGAE